MNNLNQEISNYLVYCSEHKQLDTKTIKAYKIDLTQFADWLKVPSAEVITHQILEEYIGTLHKKYKPKTVKRKIASLKALFHHLEYKDVIQLNPFNKLQIHFREPQILPKTIPLHTLEVLFKTVYQEISNARTPFQRKKALRDAAVLELLFATGMRISELCNLRASDVNLIECTVLIFGKGRKERRMQITNRDVVIALSNYAQAFASEISMSNYFFVNPSATPLSDQAVRRMINKYTSQAAIAQHITPHMFRHTFATALLEADVDIRYIQEILGHSSINVTEIYTHVALSKQRDILENKHPRNGMAVR